MTGFWAILYKEFAHIRRDRGTLFFAFLIPAIQLTIFGYAINVTIEDIPLVVLDLDQRADSRELISAFENTHTFEVALYAHSHDEFHHALTSGRAKAGIIIPPDYSARLLSGERADVQLLADGSDSQVATTAMNSANLLISRLAIGRARAFGDALHVAPARDPAGNLAPPIEARVRLLYNPNLESARFFVPGLVGIILQLVLLFLTSFSIVRERERGTLEQLFVTPVSRGGLIFGKLVPYALMAIGELLIVLVIMTTVFAVPIRGSLLLLVPLCMLFILTALGLGLLISTLARTQLGALQSAFIVMLPSVLLSGFMFPRAEMPLPIYAVSCLLPVTYFIEILRGVILRGADFTDVAPFAAGLGVCCVVILTLSVTRFRKQLA